MRLENGAITRSKDARSMLVKTPEKLVAKRREMKAETLLNDTILLGVSI
jgi:hypothetical protein